MNTDKSAEQITLQDCKNKVARGHCYSLWTELCKLGNHDGTPDDWFDEVAERYASLRCEEKDKRIKELEEALNDLLDVQNGPPLPTYEKAWNEAIAKCDKAIRSKEL
jgi:hypothetical protein